MSRAKRHNPEQIAAILMRQEGGLKVAEICRQEGISEQTFYRWKSRYGGIGASEVRRLKALEEENRRLKHLVGEKELDIQALKTIIERSTKAFTEAPGCEGSDPAASVKCPSGLSVGRPVGSKLVLPA